jgi:hypothetical protein
MRGTKMYELNRKELERMGVTLVDSESQIVFECNQCFRQWAPRFLAYAGLETGFWKCPAGCNSRRCVSGMC